MSSAVGRGPHHHRAARLSCSATTSRARASCAPICASISPATVSHDDPAAPDAPVGLHVALLDPAELGAHGIHAIAHELEVGRVDEHGDAVAVDEPAQRAAHAVEHPLGLDVERARENLLGERQREIDGLALERRGHLLAQLIDLAHGSAERGQRRVDLGVGGQHPLGASLGLAGRPCLGVDALGVGQAHAEASVRTAAQRRRLQLLEVERRRVSRQRRPRRG